MIGRHIRPISLKKNPMTIQPGTKPVLALDFGGTKLAAALVDLSDGSIISSGRRLTPRVGGAHASLEIIVQLADALLEKAGLQRAQVGSIGISFGGPLRPDRRRILRSMHIPEWESVDLAAHMEETFQKSAFMDNDANTAALGEWKFGAGRGFSNLVFVQVSTGIGAGLILQNKVYRGAGLAGEMGHIPLQPDGPLCTCGKRGCLESLASGWAIARQGRLAVRLGESPILSELAGDSLDRIDAELVLQAARMGDRGAQDVSRRAFTSLAQGISVLICLLDPEVVVIGGGVGRSKNEMWMVLEPELRAFLPAMLQDRVMLSFGKLGGNETLLGAALLTLEN